MDLASPQQRDLQALEFDVLSASPIDAHDRQPQGVSRMSNESGKQKEVLAPENTAMQDITHLLSSRHLSNALVSGHGS